MTNPIEIYRRAITYFGPAQQMLKAKEECAEFLVAAKESINASIYKTGSCWLWMPPHFKGVYKSVPKIKVNGYLQRVCHIVWIFEGNKLEENDYLVRKCRELTCVNPAHYELKSDFLSEYGVAAMNAVKTHCVHGHILFGNNLYVTPTGERKCRKCMKARKAKHQDKLDSTRVFEGKRRPTKEELTKQLNNGVSYTQIARECGLSDVAIRRWAKKWGLSSKRGKSRRIDGTKGVSTGKNTV
jgi:hypothetical protein